MKDISGRRQQSSFKGGQFKKQPANTYTKRFIAEYPIDYIEYQFYKNQFENWECDEIIENTKQIFIDYYSKHRMDLTTQDKLFLHKHTIKDGRSFLIKIMYSK